MVVVAVDLDWVERHVAATITPNRVEAPYVEALTALHTFAARYSDDGVLDEGVLLVAAGLRVLLGGDTGRLDCGTLDGGLVDVIRRCGLNPDTFTFDALRVPPGMPCDTDNESEQ